MTVVKSNRAVNARQQVVVNEGEMLSPASDVSVEERKMYKQAPVITLQNAQNPMIPVVSAHMEAQVKNTKTVESGRMDRGPVVSSDSPTLVGNPEVPLKEDGK